MAEAVQGRTRWGRFAVVMVPCAVAIAVMAGALLNGILATSLAVAGVPLQLKVNKLDGKALTLYAGEIQPLVGNTLPVAVAGVGEAKIDGLCLGLGADVPVLGKVAVKATSGQQVTASNLILDAKSLGGDLKATDANVGQDASAFTIGNPAAKGTPGTLGLQAGGVELSNLTNTSYGLLAGSLTLKDVSIDATSGTTTPC